MKFHTLDADSFEYGRPSEVVDGVRRVIAKNPSKFTYHGTGTYLIGRGDVVVVDPGPLLDDHRSALAEALDGETVRAILVTHSHSDHSPLAAWLRDHSGAPTVAVGAHGATTDTWDLGSLPEDFAPTPPPDADGAADIESEPKMEESIDTEFVPDIVVGTGDAVEPAPASMTIRAVHTPGHTSNHACYSVQLDGRRILFSGDHVMGWSTTVVSPPDGDMAAYIESLRRVATIDHDVALPTHGPPIPDPGAFIGDLVEHRLERERQVVDALGRGLVTIPAMVTDLYAAVPVGLHRAAAYSVLGHLVKLVDDATVVTDDGGRPRLDSTFAVV